MKKYIVWIGIIAATISMSAAIFSLISAIKAENNTCRNQLIKVDSEETFICRAKGKVSQQVIDDVKYNVCTCKESK